MQSHLATSRKWKDKAGDKVEETEWHRLVAYDKLAEIIGQYLKKGAQIYVEGRLKTRKWQDQQGQDRYTTEILADEMKMLGKRDAPAGPPAEAGKPAGAPAAAKAPGEAGGILEDLGDGIPF